MEQYISPKQVARAIGVSESSLKRWCDRGLIPMVRTAGGHRRLPISGVLRFLRESEHELVVPDALGLPATTGSGSRVTDRAREQLVEALISGNEPLARGIVFDQYLAGHALSAICDDVVAEAFHQIGELWSCSEVSVYQERRGCEICRRVLDVLRMGIPPRNAQCPTAIGATPEGDPYVLPTMMAELVLAECGCRAQSLGSSIPFASLESAVTEQRPRLFWISVSYFTNTGLFLEQYASFYDVAVRAGAAVVVGGQALVDDVRRQMRYAAYCDNMRHLEAFAMTLAAV